MASVFATEDRKEQGLVLLMSIEANVTMTSLAKTNITLQSNFKEEGRALVGDYVGKVAH